MTDGDSALPPNLDTGRCKSLASKAGATSEKAEGTWEKWEKNDCGFPFLSHYSNRDMSNTVTRITGC